MRKKQENYLRGFTLIELIIVVAILLIVGAIAIPGIISLQNAPELNNAAEEIIGALRTAQNQTLSSFENSQYGVYFDLTTSPHQYILFKGSSYALRSIASDRTYKVPSDVEFYQVNTGGGGQIVFDKLTGATANVGNVSLRLKSDNNQTKIVYIDNSGAIGYTALSVPLDTARVKDSRHIDFNYSRNIDTATENIILNFDGLATQTIPMSEHMVNGQFEFEGTYNVGGTDQIIAIHTISLNSPDTKFSVFRDLRFNDKSLAITISADNTGTLAEYSADGVTVDFHSIYVNNFSWQ